MTDFPKLTKIPTICLNTVLVTRKAAHYTQSITIIVEEVQTFNIWLTCSASGL